MEHRALPTLFHIKKNEEILAILESCEPSGEMFWLICSFKPSVSFADVEQLFHQASEYAEKEDIDAFENAYEQLRGMGVVLLDVKNNIEIKYFAIHFIDHNVHLRYAEPPYLEE